VCDPGLDFGHNSIHFWNCLEANRWGRSKLGRKESWAVKGRKEESEEVGRQKEEELQEGTAFDLQIWFIYSILGTWHVQIHSDKTSVLRFGLRELQSVNQQWSVCLIYATLKFMCCWFFIVWTVWRLFRINCCNYAWVIGRFNSNVTQEWSIMKFFGVV
jgi:hypothetical protein